ERDGRFAHLAAPGRDEDDAVGSLHTVGCGGGSVLQDRDRLDVGGVDRCQRVAVLAATPTNGHTVDDVQRLCVAHGTDTTDTNGDRRAGKTRHVGNLHTRDAALNGLVGAGNRQLADFVGA